MRNLFLGFGAGVAVGAGGCYLYLTVVQKPEARRVGRGGVELDHPALKHGVPETDIIRVYDGYVAAYDYRTRNPKWVAEHLTPASWTGEANRERSEFFPDPEVDPRFSAKLSDYRGSGYDRGHMAPAANHKDSQKAMDQTFSLVNISPQAGKGFNRDYWARFERFVKELTDVAGNVYVITGPLWLPTQQQLDEAAAAGGAAGGANGGPTSKWTLTHDWIGKPPGLVAVPTHYYKVILADTRGDDGSAASKQPPRGNKQPLPPGAVGVGAFVMPNAPIDPRTPLAAYVVPLEDLEQVAGTSFFPALLGDSRRREAADVAAAGWRAAGMSQLKPFERLNMKQAFAALPPPASTMTIDVEASTSSSSGGSSGRSSAADAPRPPKTPAGSGVVHICEVNACKLPPTDFFQRGSGGGGGGGGGGSRGSSAPASPRSR